MIYEIECEGISIVVSLVRFVLLFELFDAIFEVDCFFRFLRKLLCAVLNPLQIIEILTS